ncbi:interleukin-12 subunit beta [Danio aesculapii]|uniref:interleukin-12 subunit beta n=1 Tax=Danio aesculapii TaxID=1142201 RepID=UPI0024C03D23|nr:interleukin-12 subunit beta [Danio aesculapii]
MCQLTRVILLLCLSVVRLSALNFFPGKFKVGERGTNVILTCQTSKDEITWKHQDAHSTSKISGSEFEKVSGRTLTLMDLDEDQIGNYTCWSQQGLEDYTYLLLDKTKETTAFNINCTAESFSCTERIKCSWRSDAFTAFRLRNSRDNGNWVSESVDGVFSLPHSTDSYSEESERLQITGEALSACCYIRTDYSFFLRDIVKPANPNISICRVKNEGSDEQIIEVEVKPPSSWPQPQSFFPLTHQIQYENRHDGKLKTKEWEEGSKVKVQGLIRKLRARCRDPLLVSQWSEWTPWTNVSDSANGNNGRLDRNTKKGKKMRNCQKKHQRNHPKNHQNNKKKHQNKKQKHVNNI